MYIQNTLSHTLVLKAGYLKLAVGATNTIPLTEEDLKEATIADAISRGWAKKVDGQIEAVAPTPVIPTVASTKGGLTLDELKAEQAAKVEKPAATTTELGQNDGIPSGGAEGTAIGTPVESTTVPPVAEPVVEAATPVKAPKAKK